MISSDKDVDTSPEKPSDDEKSNSESRKQVSKARYRKPTNIVLIGMTGCGKSTLGWLLSHQIGLGFFDSDAWITKQAKKPISKIFAEDGEARFRKWEKEAMKFVANIRNHVISVGGGVLDDDGNWDVLKSIGTTVYIDCSVDEIVQRLKNNTGELEKRPLLSDIIKEEDKDIRHQKLTDRLTVLFKQREKQFTQANFTINEKFSTAEISVRKMRLLLKR